MKEKDREDEFREFSSAPGITPAAALSESLFRRVRSDLNPPLWRVLSKLAAIHLAAGSLTLLFCPQFGVSPWGNSGLMLYLMKLGERACMFGCGALFMATSALFAVLLLTAHEVRKLRSRELVYVPALALFSLGGFFCLGGDVVMSLGLVWLAGSVLGGLASLELGWLVRSSMRGEAGLVRR